MQIFDVIIFFKLRTIQQKTVKPTYLCFVCFGSFFRTLAVNSVSDFSVIEKKENKRKEGEQKKKEKKKEEEKTTSSSTCGLSALRMKKEKSVSNSEETIPKCLITDPTTSLPHSSS